jgi:hypothetical protein
MTAVTSPCSPAEGLVRLTWVTDQLAHVLEHADTDEPTGTWTGLACPDYGLPIGHDVDAGVLRQLCTSGEVADFVWEPPNDVAAKHARAFTAAMTAYQSGNIAAVERHWNDLAATWSRAWTANCATLDVLQHAGITRFAPEKPQHWVIASFEHHCGPHGAVHPHVHNIVVVGLTTSSAGESARSARTSGPLG